MPLLSIDHISIAFGAEKLLDGASFQLDAGERVCLIGRNGTGKTTLLRLLASELQPDGGEIWRQPSLRVATLAQELPAAEMVLELGRYLVGEAGIYVARVLDRKVSRGQVFLVTDGGMHHHLAASGNFGQVIRRNYPVAIGNRLQSVERELASVVGPLCTPLDMLADKLELAVAQPGGLVVVFQSGAYGATASPQAFLGHPACIEVLV